MKVPWQPIRLVILTVALATASCFPSQVRSDVRFSPIDLERRGERVFAQYLIPVSEHTTDYRVRSGRFVVDEVWGVGAIEDRVNCGRDTEGLPRAVGARVELSVSLRISDSGGSTRVALDSEGRTVPDAESADAVACRLTDRFSKELIDAVAGEFPVEPGVRRGPAIPGHPGR